MMMTGRGEWKGNGGVRGVEQFQSNNLTSYYGAGRSYNARDAEMGVARRI